MEGKKKLSATEVVERKAERTYRGFGSSDLREDLPQLLIAGSTT
jgi:hypothetical protein